MSVRSWADWILKRALPEGLAGEAIRGELREELEARRARLGVVAADRWYLRQAIGVWLFATRDRLTGWRWREGPLSPGRPVPVGPIQGDGPLTGAIRHVRMAFRSLVRAPGFTVPALLILAIGMTAATAVFAVVDGIVVRPLDLPDSERLVIVCEEHRELQGLCIASPANVEDFRDGAVSLAELGVGRGWPFVLTDAEGTRGARGGLATAGFLRALQVRPALGRIFRDEEVGPGMDRVVLLSHAFWTTRYGGDPEIVGSVVQLDGASHEVVGVLPRGLEIPLGLDGIQIWKPPHFDPLAPEIRGWRGFRAIGRLAEDASLPEASAELTSLYARLALQHPEIDGEWRLRVAPLLDVVVGDTRPVLVAFLAAAGLLLLIVCANVANLLLARGMDRRRELALRAALGADRRRLVMGILVESFVLAGLATALALVLASGATRAFLALAPPDIPRLDEVALGGRALAFAALLAVPTTFVFALLPALRVTRWNLGDTLKSGGYDHTGAGAGRLRSGLLIVELGLSLVLLTSAGLVTRAFARYLEWEPGFDRSHLLAVSAFVDTGRYPTDEAVTRFWRAAEETVRGVPGVEAVATASAGPLFGGGDGTTPFHVSGTERGDALPSAAWHDIGPGFFRTLGLPVIRGREITEDDGAGAPLAAVVNEAFVRAAGPGGDVLGRMVRLPELGADLELEVVGVVPDVPPMTPGALSRPAIHWSNRQLGRPATFLLVRTRDDPEGSAQAIIDALLGLDPDLALGTPETLSRAEERALVRPRFQAAVLLAFALVALALSAVGVYAVVSYAVARRVREMGIRMALGAAASDVVRLILRSSLRAAAAGTALGLLASVWVGRLLAAAIPGVNPGDPWSLGGAALILLAAAMFSTLIPAGRAVRGDPLRAIRGD